LPTSGNVYSELKNKMEFISHYILLGEFTDGHIIEFLKGVLLLADSAFKKVVVYW
jgi:hypothetical protein